ncbi:phosphate signaling complex protein PhoU [Sulfuricystis multivorans]|uniref:phosphate signaling complex protein PhoU n=1 Tax=Sulfuricystis multivorans TaxID=2211108 RepID=UPI000F84155A|nr:phosphate signaling complex protein PhoU [Sulfuricystis multivorans]
MHEHIFKRFDTELDDIRARITQMGGLVEEQMRAALNALDGEDRELVDLVIARDAGVDQMEVSIDAACAHIIARRQPTAVDLRMIMAVSKIVTDLERIGDEVKKIAKGVRKVFDQGMSGCLTQVTEIRYLGERVQGMLHDVLDAFVRVDDRAALTIIARDKEIDESFRSIVRQMITYMMEDPRTISTALDIIFIARSVERIGDHVKNIARDVIFIARGEDVRHTPLGKMGTAEQDGQ